MTMVRATAFCLALIAVCEWAVAETNWPQFRGADVRGVAANRHLPDRWSATENVAWKTDIPGRGWSSPIVWGNRVFLTTVVNTGDGGTKEGPVFRRRPTEASGITPSVEGLLP